MAKLTVVIFTVSFMCLVLLDGVFAAEEQAVTTTVKPAEAGVTNPVTTPAPPKTTGKPADPVVPSVAPVDPEKDKPKDTAAAQPSTQTTEATKSAENTDGKGNNSGTTIVANAVVFVSAVFLCSRF